MKFPNSTDGLLAEENPELFFLSPSAQRDYLIAEGFVQTDDSSNTWILDTGIEHRECIFLPKSGLVAFDTHDGRRRIFLSGSGTYSVLLDEAGTSRIVFVTFPDIEGVFLYRLGAGGATTPVSAPDG